MGQDAKQNNTAKQEEKHDDKQENVKAKSRLGKEAKIGVVVILLLLTGLGAAIVMRVRGSGADDKVATASPDAKATASTPASASSETKNDPFLNYKSKSHNSSSPTIVPAKSAASKPPKMSGTDLDKWKMPPSKSESKAVAKTDATSAAPPMPPAPPKSAKNDRYDRYGLDSGDSVAMEPAPKPLRPSKNDAQLLAPEVPAAPAGQSDAASSGIGRSNGRGYRDSTDNTGGDRYGLSSAEPPPSRPSYRDDARYDRATALPPPPSRDAGSSYADSRRSSDSPGTSYSGSQGRTIATSGSSMNDSYDYRGSGGNSYGSTQASRRSSASFNSTPRRDDGKYEIQPNDSFWTISEKVYGSGAYFKALMQHNRASVGDERLQPGQLVFTPSVAELEKAYPDLCPKASRRETMQSRGTTVSSRPQHRSSRTYTVAEGDTLFNIARYELGKASRWVEIYDLNRDVLGKDFNYLTPGLQLAMPDGDKAEVIAQPPANNYRR